MPAKHSIRHQSPAKSKQKGSNIIETSDVIGSSSVDPSPLRLSNGDGLSPYCTPPQSPPPRPRPRTRNTSLKQSKGKNLPPGMLC